jgi:hypothetical protein
MQKGGDVGGVHALKGGGGGDGLVGDGFVRASGGGASHAPRKGEVADGFREDYEDDEDDADLVWLCVCVWVGGCVCVGVGGVCRCGCVFRR